MFILSQATPSIEDLMKKSLTLDKQSQSPSKRFERPKITKTIKAQPSHFTESAKASKFENLDSLSEMFTIPQYSSVQPGDNNVPVGHVTENTTDDWSDFSSATESVSQEQNISSGPGTSTLGHGLGPGFSIPSIPSSMSSQMVPTSSTSAESSSFMCYSGNEGVGRILQEPRMNVDMFSQSASAIPASTMWNPQVPDGSEAIFVGTQTHMSQGNNGQEVSNGGDFGDFQSEVPVSDSSTTTQAQG